jgi:hypothetical protein
MKIFVDSSLLFFPIVEINSLITFSYSNGLKFLVFKKMVITELRPRHLVALSFLAFCVYYANAQALNDPITQYIEGRLGNRRIFWCPSGYGYLAYCPQPTDWDNYNWCCTWPYMGSWKPSCCPFAIPTGAVVAIIIAAIILLAVLIGLSCWCCYCCPLYKQLYEYEDDDINPGGR